MNVSGLLVWFTAQLGYVFWFYFAVFCAMFTGNAFAMPIFTASCPCWLRPWP